jgi:hypothetical protein
MEPTLASKAATDPAAPPRVLPAELLVPSYRLLNPSATI